MNGLSIYSKQTPSGFEIKFRGQKYVLNYPDKIWQKYPQQAKDVLYDNLVYSETLHLPLHFKSNRITYNTSSPYLQTYFFQNMIMDLPSCADVDRTFSTELLKEYMNLKIRFKDNEIKFPNYRHESKENSSVVSFSFGKDSLLTWSVCNEIGLNPQAAYIVEPALTYEERHKDKLAVKFQKEFGVGLQKIEHSVGQLRDGHRLGVGKSEVGWGLQSTQYAIIILPIADHFQSKFILFGNEQSCGEYYTDKQGFVCYPAYDQCHIWTKQIDSITRQLTLGGVQTMSVIEPLNDIAVVYILFKRYPDVAKYHMSCFVETETGKDHRWCRDCSVCSKMYLLIRASGFDPRTVGLDKNMLEKEMRSYYSLFGGSDVQTYALTGRGRDEQLFAFYLAWRNGDRSSLVEEFENRFLDEAIAREDELFKTFFGIHESITIPKRIEEKVTSIYKEVLNDLS